MTTEESLTTMSIPWSTDIVTTQTITDSLDTDGTSISSINSSIVILVWFEIVAACIVYGLGFIGNVLSLIIFCSLEEFRKISTGCFFLLTTISNSFHLWSLTTEFLGVFNVYIYPTAFLQCRLNFYVQNVSRAMSTYLAVGIALDRLVRSEMPMRSRIICTRRNAIIYSLSMLVIFLLLWSIWLSPTIDRDPVTGACINNRSAIVYFILSQVQVPVRAILVAVIPVIVMAAANIRMLSNMRQSRRRVAVGGELNTATVTAITAVNNGPPIRRMSEIDRMLFYMMLANVGTFIVTQIPFHIYTVVQSYYKQFDTFTSSLIRAILLIWSSIYFGVAFYFYCFASPLFHFVDHNKQTYKERIK